MEETPRTKRGFRKWLGSLTLADDQARFWDLVVKTVALIASITVASVGIVQISVNMRAATAAETQRHRDAVRAEKEHDAQYVQFVCYQSQAIVFRIFNHSAVTESAIGVWIPLLQSTSKDANLNRIDPIIAQLLKSLSEDISLAKAELLKGERVDNLSPAYKKFHEDATKFLAQYDSDCALRGEAAPIIRK